MKIYNTLNRRKNDFVPITPGKIKMYTCGQTVYNDIHMGNARFYVVFDAIRRYLAYKGYEVQFVQNFTDIDDKIIQRAAEEGCAVEEISGRYIARTLEDLDALKVERATHNPLVTREMPEIIDMIDTLIRKGFAYESAGTVYYDVTAFKGYGKLSGKNTEDLEAGARVEVEASKRNPVDFVLWKPAKQGEPKWESPWGEGRPGWHIECSATVRKYLGDEIDIHGGGEDLIFPHHENEIAQSEAATGQNFARYWMHCGVLTTDHKKMSKSGGNFFTLRELAEKYPHDVIRFYFLSGHYRMPMEFSDTVMQSARQGLSRIKNCYGNLQHLINTGGDANTDETAGQPEEIRPFMQAFFDAMDDDFNTADAITAIFEFVKHINTRLAETSKHSLGYLKALSEGLTALAGILGIELAQAEHVQESAEADAEVEALIAARQEARKNKDFAESDRIRDQLTGMGIILEDTREGIRWRRG